MFTQAEQNPLGMEELASSLGVSEFDMMVVGDGAGSLAETPYGWACANYERKGGVVRWVWGGGSGGTNQVAELEPAIHSVTSYRATLLSDYLRRSREEKTSVQLPTVLLVSDSEVTVRCGTGEYERKSNMPFWASISWLEAKGYKLIWKWVPRNSNPFNRAADRVAKAVRAAMAESNLRGC